MSNLNVTDQQKEQLPEDLKEVLGIGVLVTPPQVETALGNPTGLMEGSGD